MEIKIWNALTDLQKQECLTRPAQTSSDDIELIVKDIIANIRKDGDKALREYSKTLDHFTKDNLELTEDEIAKACANVPQDLKDAIKEAYHNIYRLHEAQKPNHVDLETYPGIFCHTRTHAIDAVGLYVPGGSAPLVSTALMLAVPAQIAGCKEVILCSPPPISDAIIYAANLCNVKRIFNLGGAQAIAAMAYGTETVPKMLKLFGPGNQFVTMAKRLVSSDPAGAAIDMPAGPSEVLVIADKDANPTFVAADLLSQAEHGPDSQVILVTTDESFAHKVSDAVEIELEKLPRKEVAIKALSKSTAIVVDSLDKAVLVSNTYAPEHLILQINNPDSILDSLHNAGSIFVGAYTPESLGDYASGTNHTLPTYGYGHTFSALGTDDYRRRYTVQRATAQGLKGISKTVEALASAESLEAHRLAVALRIEE